MSHFCGLVILTPKYEKDIDDSLEKYNENVEVQEYCADKVSKADKKRFVKYYTGKRFYTKKSFEELYAEKGAEWNSNQWRKDEKGVWQVYSTSPLLQVTIKRFGPNAVESSHSNVRL